MSADPHAGAALHWGGATAGRAAVGIVALHGRGAGPADILGLVDHLALPEIAAVAPAAVGRSWWPTSFLAPMDALEPFLGSAIATVGCAVAALEAAGLARDRIALLGFSQGACLATEVAARTGGPWHSVWALSGALVGTSDGDGAPDPALYGHRPKRFDGYARLDGVPIYLGCHAADPHIPVARVEDSAKVFRGLGATVETHIFPGAGHGIVPSEVQRLRGALNA